jgi:hypothetical protein
LGNHDRDIEPRNFPGRLSTQFKSWFSMALVLPLILLLYFGVTDYRNRERLQIHKASENMVFQSLELENFFLDRFIPVYQQSLLDVVNALPNDFLRDQDHSYWKKLYPILGLPPPRQY